MKLAIFAPNILPVPAIKGGAVEELTTYIIEENDKSHRYDIDLYTVDNDGILNDINYKYTKIIKVKFRPNGKKDKYFFYRNKLIRRFPSGRIESNFSRTMASYFKTDYYDAVLIEDSREIFNSVLPKIKDEKLYFHLHDDFDLPNENTSRLKKIIKPLDLNMVKNMIKKSYRIITVSDYLKKRLEKLGANNIVTLYNGIIRTELIPQNSVESKAHWIKKLNIDPENDFVITFIGRFTSDKGPDKLLKALKLLKGKGHIKCLIVGKNWLHSERENNFTYELNKIYDQLPLEVKKNILFTGYVDHSKIGEIYSISNCLIIPSQYEEAFGVVALEAMSLGVPVIASNSGGLPEVLGNTGIIVKRGPKFESNLAAEIKKLAESRKLQMKIEKKEIMRSHDFPNTKEEYFNNFCKIVK